MILLLIVVLFLAVAATVISLSDFLPFGIWIRQGRTQLPPLQASFAGKTLFLTGASGALVSVAARQVLAHGAERLIFAVPDIPEGREGHDTLVHLIGEEESVRRVTVWHLDLLSFDSIRSVAGRANRELDKLDGALMGAGVITTQKRIAESGWDWHLQINHLGSALLTLLLLPVLERSSQRHGGPVVLSAITSMGSRISGLLLPSPQDGETLLGAINGLQGYVGVKSLYGTTKLVHLWFLRELATRYRQRGVIVHACDFGVSSGSKGVATSGFESRLFGRFLGRKPTTIARVIVNSMVAREEEHGTILMDYSVAE
jgi:retinol dehydrogenase 12